MSLRSGALVLLVAIAGGALLVPLFGFGDAGERDVSRTTVRQHIVAPRPTQRAAVQAATDFLISLDLEVLLSDRKRARIIRRAAAPDANAALQTLYAEEERRVASSYRRAPRFARAALAGYRVDQFAPPDATVSIWAATIGGSGSHQPASGWSTTTVSLEWLGRTWRVAEVQHSAGPAPDWPTATLAAEGRRFREYRNAP